MATLDEVLALAIEGYDEDSEFDGIEQIVKESVTEYYYNFDVTYNQSLPAAEILKRYREAYQGWWDTPEEFAQQLAEDIGNLTPDPGWPYSCIDWTQAARELMQNYWESDGYYFRSM